MKSKFILILVFLCMLIGTNCFQYAFIDRAFIGRAELTLSFLVLLSAFFLRKKEKGGDLPFEKLLKYFFVIPMLSIISIITLYNESIEWELRFVVIASNIFFYYLFRTFQIGEKTLVNVVFAFSLVAFCIQLLQQMNPSIAVFGIVTDDSIYRGNVAEIRNGLYRFRIGTTVCTLLSLYYFLQRWLMKKTLMDSVLLLVFLSSMYLYLTRQIMISTIVTIVFSMFFVQTSIPKKRKIGIIVSVCLVILSLWSYSDVLFGELASKTREESTEDNIRSACFDFYWSKITGNPIGFLFGSGFPVELDKWKFSYGLYPSDIGIVGEWFHHGIFQILLYFYVVYLVLLKYRRVLPGYMILFVFSTFCTSPLIFPYRKSYEYLIWAIVFYICDMHISQSKNKIR